VNDLEKIFMNKNMPLDNIKEITQDALFFSLFLRMKREMKDISAKSYLSLFMKQLSSLFLLELMRVLQEFEGVNIKDIFKKFDKYNQKLKNERNKIKLKIKDSDTIKNKTNNMGIDFNTLTYDINIFLNSSNKLLYFNFEEFAEDEDFLFWDTLFVVPEMVLQIILKKDLDEIFEEPTKNFDVITNLLEKNISSKCYAYSTYKLFNKKSNLDNEDKNLILYRYRLIESIILVCIIFFNFGDLVMIYSDHPELNFSFKDYLRKLKSLVIDIVGNDLMELNTNFSKGVLKKINSVIPENFYSVNRKVRNNIHYKSNYSIITDEDKKILDEYQNKYLDIVSEEFGQCLNIVLDKEFLVMNKVLEEYRNIGMTTDEIQENYEDLYIKYWNQLD